MEAVFLSVTNVCFYDVVYSLKMEEKSYFFSLSLLFKIM